MHVCVHILNHVRQPLEFTQSEVTDVGTVAKEKSSDLGGNWRNRGNRFIGGKGVEDHRGEFSHLHKGHDLENLLLFISLALNEP